MRRRRVDPRRLSSGPTMRRSCVGEDLSGVAARTGPDMAVGHRERPGAAERVVELRRDIADRWREDQGERQRGRHARERSGGTLFSLARTGIRRSSCGQQTGAVIQGIAPLPGTGSRERSRAAEANATRALLKARSALMIRGDYASEARRVSMRRRRPTHQDCINLWPVFISACPGDPRRPPYRCQPASTRPPAPAAGSRCRPPSGSVRNLQGRASGEGGRCARAGIACLRRAWRPRPG